MSRKTLITVAHGDGIGPEVIVKTETLRTFDGQQRFTLAQGQ